MNRTQFLTEGGISPESDYGQFVLSTQFDYAEKLLDYEFTHHLTQEEMAELLHLDLADFLRLEYGDRHLPLSLYREVLARLDSGQALRITDLSVQQSAYAEYTKAQINMNTDWLLVDEQTSLANVDQSNYQEALPSTDLTDAKRLINGGVQYA